MGQSDVTLTPIESAERPAPPSSPPPLQPGDSDRIAFHLEEFKSLKAEIAELVKVTWTNLQYAILSSGAIIAWVVTTRTSKLASAGPTPPLDENLRILTEIGGAAAPLLLSAAFGLLAAAAYYRIQQMGGYLRRIEDQMKASGLGWEQLFGGKSSFMKYFHQIAWTILLLGDLGFAIAILKK